MDKLKTENHESIEKVMHKTKKIGRNIEQLAEKLESMSESMTKDMKLLSLAEQSLLDSMHKQQRDYFVNKIKNAKSDRKAFQQGVESEGMPRS